MFRFLQVNDIPCICSGWVLFLLILLNLFSVSNFVFIQFPYLGYDDINSCFYDTSCAISALVLFWHVIATRAYVFPDLVSFDQSSHAASSQYLFFSTRALMSLPPEDALFHSPISVQSPPPSSSLCFPPRKKNSFTTGTTSNTSKGVSSDQTLNHILQHKR